MHGRSAAVLVRKPLGLWVTGWPKGGKSTFVAVQKDDLPSALPKEPTRLYLQWLAAVDKDDFFAAFEAHMPQRIAQWLVENSAAVLAHQKAQGREITPGEMAGGNCAFGSQVFAPPGGGKLVSDLWRHKKMAASA